jgi:GT2 family glycosyltransferase
LERLGLVTAATATCVQTHEKRIHIRRRSPGTLAAAQAAPRATPSITVAICTRNRAPLLRKAIRGVLGQVVDEAELLIVDNGSTDDTGSVVRPFVEACQRVRTVHEPRIGLSRARNLALQEARGNWVVYLDDDALPEPGWLAAYRDFFSQLPNGRIACAGGPVTPYHDGPAGDGLGLCAYRLRGADTSRPFSPKGSPIGCNYAVRREAALAVGAFNIALGRSGGFSGTHEEIELTERLRGAGLEVWWVPGARIRHLVTLEKLGMPSRLRFAFDEGRSRGIRRWNETAVGRRATLVATRVLVAPFHVGVNLLAALAICPFRKGRLAKRSLIKATSIVGMTCQLLLLAPRGNRG